MPLRTGLFDGFSRISDTGIERRIYCLHHATKKPPWPIADLQSVPATAKHVGQWLRGLFDHTHQKKQVFWNVVQI